MFEVENEANSIVKFTFKEPFTTDDLKKVLALVSSMLNKQKPFAFYVDTVKANRPPVEAATLLIHWLRANRELAKKYLICTCVIFSNTTANVIAKNLLIGVFKIQPTVAPNLITCDINKGVNWVKIKVSEHNNK